MMIKTPINCTAPLRSAAYAEFCTSVLVFVLIFLGGLDPVSAALSGSSLNLTLKSEAQIASKNIVLGDLVFSPASLPPEIIAVRMGMTPNLNDSRPITQDMVNMAIKAQLKSEIPIVWSGSTTCTVTRPSRLITTLDLTTAIVPALSRLTGASGTVNIEEFSSITPTQIPAGRAQAIVEVNSSALTNAWTNASITFVVEGETVATKSIRFHWSWIRDGWIAQKPLPAGTPLSTNDFTLTRVDGIAAGPSLITDSTLSPSKMIARAMTTGQILTTNVLGLKKIVQKGDHVVINYKVSSLKVTMQGVALEDGVQGASIMVMNSSSNQRLMARIVDDHNLDFLQKL